MAVCVHTFVCIWWGIRVCVSVYTHAHLLMLGRGSGRWWHTRGWRPRPSFAPSPRPRRWPSTLQAGCHLAPNAPRRLQCLPNRQLSAWQTQSRGPSPRLAVRATQVSLDPQGRGLTWTARAADLLRGSWSGNQGPPSWAATRNRKGELVPLQPPGSPAASHRSGGPQTLKPIPTHPAPASLAQGGMCEKEVLSRRPRLTDAPGAGWPSGPRNSRAVSVFPAVPWARICVKHTAYLIHGHQHTR